MAFWQSPCGGMLVRCEGRGASLQKPRTDRHYYGYCVWENNGTSSQGLHIHCVPICSSKQSRLTWGLRTELFMCTSLCDWNTNTPIYILLPGVQILMQRKSAQSMWAMFLRKLNKIKKSVYLGLIINDGETLHGVVHITDIAIQLARRLNRLAAEKSSGCSSPPASTCVHYVMVRTIGLLY